MRPAKWLLLAPILALLMAPTGGFPSRPTFQSATITGLTTTGTLTSSGAATLASATVTGLTTTGTLTSSGASTLKNFSVSANGNAVLTAPTSGIAVSAAGAANAYAGSFVANSTSGQSFGLVASGGTTGADRALHVTNQAVTVSYFDVYGDGGVTAGAPTGGDKGVGSINATGLFQNGLAVPLFSYAQCNGVSSALVGGTAKANITTCTFNSTGNYTIPFTASYTTNIPVCTASASSGQNVARVNPALGSVGIIVSLATTGAVANDAVQVSCVGT